MAGPWKVASPTALSWRSWAGEIVVYDDGSGDTHYLEPLAAEVFERLLEAPADLDELGDRVARSLAVDRDDRLGEAIDAAVDKLRVCGLIAQRAPRR